MSDVDGPLDFPFYVQSLLVKNFLADVYFDDFYVAERLSIAAQAFSQLGQLFTYLGLDSSPEKDSPPSTSMICLGILLDTAAFTLEVPPD